MFWEKYELLCKRNGKSPNTVGKEKGKVPHAPTLRKIADYFGVSVEYLLGQTDDRSEEKNRLLKACIEKIHYTRERPVRAERGDKSAISHNGWNFSPISINVDIKV